MLESSLGGMSAPMLLSRFPSFRSRLRERLRSLVQTQRLRARLHLMQMPGDCERPRVPGHVLECSAHVWFGNHGTTAGQKRHCLSVSPSPAVAGGPLPGDLPFLAVWSRSSWCAGLLERPRSFCGGPVSLWSTG